jgi:hypothetical protein
MRGQAGSLLLPDLTPWSLSSTGGGVFLLGADDALTELAESAFGTEDELQDLIARHPRLISSALSSEADRRWLLVAREQPVASAVDGGARWWLDHLLLDQDGVPTLVEVKRSTDTRLRREVIGQMLDYAASAVGTWRAASLREVVEAEPDAISRLLPPDADVDAFWEQVEANLRAGRLRLVFLADRIPPELERSSHSSTHRWISARCGEWSCDVSPLTTVRARSRPGWWVPQVC